MPKLTGRQRAEADLVLTLVQTTPEERSMTDAPLSACWRLFDQNGREQHFFFGDFEWVQDQLAGAAEVVLRKRRII